MIRWRSAAVIIAAVTAIISLLVLASGMTVDVGYRAGFIPARLSGAVAPYGALPAVVTPWSSLLIHLDVMHLLINLLMLVWIGSRVERVLGAGGVVVLYLVGALVAAAAQWAWDPGSVSPVVGASPAVSALVGTFGMMFATPNRLTGSKLLDRAIHSLWLLAAWVVLQLLIDLISARDGLVVAAPAHVGGLVVGLLLHRPLLLWRYRKA